MISWERFRTTVAEAEALAQPEGFDIYQKLGEHYAGMPLTWEHVGFSRTSSGAHAAAIAGRRRPLSVGRNAKAG